MRYLALLLLLIPTLSRSNGGPIDESYMYNTGNIILQTYSEVDLTREDLDIKVLGDWVEVTVHYSFENNSGSDEHIKYGFPIRTLAVPENSEGDSVEYSAFIRNYSVQANGDELDWKGVQQGITAHNDESVARLGWPETINIWHVSDLKLAPGRNDLVITYQVRSMLSDWSTSKSPLPSFSARSFKYDLSPAANWGDGNIERFNITIDFSEILDDNPIICFPGLPFMKAPDSGILEFSHNFFEIEDSSSFNFDYEYDLVQRYINKTKIAHSLFNIAASSTLESYPVSNVLDGNPNTAWVEGKDGLGAGERIVITFDQPTRVTGMGIAAGYHKDITTYRNNGRPDLLTIRLTHADGETQDMDVDLYREFNENIPDGMTGRYEWFTIYGYNNVTKLEIILDASIPGDRYEDVCISDIIMLSE